MQNSALFEKLIRSREFREPNFNEIGIKSLISPEQVAAGGRMRGSYIYRGEGAE